MGRVEILELLLLKLAPCSKLLRDRLGGLKSSRRLLPALVGGADRAEGRRPGAHRAKRSSQRGAAGRGGRVGAVLALNGELQQQGTQLQAAWLGGGRPRR